jgi:hypothetical protein
LQPVVRKCWADLTDKIAIGMVSGGSEEAIPDSLVSLHRGTTSERVGSVCPVIGWNLVLPKSTMVVVVAGIQG